MTNTNPATAIFKRAWWVAMAAFALAMVAGVYFYNRIELERVREDRYQDIRIVGEMKAKEIERWRNKRKFDTSKLAKSPLMVKATAALLNDPNNTSLRADIRARLSLELEDRSYTDAVLLKPDGSILISAQDVPDPLDSTTHQAVASTLATHAVVIGDPHKSPRGFVQIDIVSPMFDSLGQLLVVALLRIDADAFLYPLIQSWPTPSPSAETLLVHRSQDDVVFLNELRHQRNTALSLRVPLNHADLPGVQAVLGKQGMFQGNDYRDVEVVADLRPIPGSDWFLVAKMDADEMYSALYQRMRMTALFAGLIVLLAAAMVAMLYRQRQAKMFLRLYESEKNRREAQEQTRESERKFQEVVKNLDEAYYSCAVDGALLEHNVAFNRLLGFNIDQDLKGSKLPDFWQDPKDRKPYLDELMTKGVVRNFLINAKTIGGAKLVTMANSHLVRDEKGNPVRIEGTFTDFTERKQMEESIRQSEENYRTLFNSAGDSIFIREPSGRFLDANDAACLRLGYSRAELLTMTPRDLDDPSACVDMDRRTDAIQREGKALFETVHIARDGSRIPTEISSRLISIKGNHAILSIARDITERKRAEAALRRSEHFLDAVVENTPNPMWISDEHGTVIRQNQALRTLLQVSDEEIVGKYNVLKDVQVKDQGFLPLVESVFREGRTVEFEIDYHTGKEEQVRLAQTSHQVLDIIISAVTDDQGKVVHAIAQHKDITERKRAVEELQQSEERFRILFEQAADIILLMEITPGGIPVIQKANSATFKILGYQPDDLIGKPVSSIEPAPDASKLVDERRRNILSGIGQTFEASHRCKDDTIRDFECSAREIQIGSKCFAISVERDITDRKRSEAERLKLEEQLRVSQKMEAIGSLAGGVAHDFNNLLSIILSNTGFAIEETKASDPLFEDLQEVKRAAERAAALTRQLLAFSRKQVLEPELLNLNQSVEGTAKMLRRILGEDIDLVQMLAPDLGLTLADSGQIEQVLMNLAVNARDAMPDGGKLTIETSNVEIDEEYAASHVAMTPGPYIMLAVSDSGCGMDEQTRARIFEPFFTTKEKGRGTGLGLSTVYGIIKQSGGNIWVYSEPGQGTTFKIYLPREVGATATAVKPPLAPIRTTGTETLLVVEDEEALLKIAKRALEAAGYTVMAAKDGEEALRTCALHTGKLHLLLTDVVMPQMSGRKLAQELEKLRPNLKVLYMSGYTDNAIVHHGVLDPGTHFLSKPFTMDDLKRKIREVLDEGSANPD